MKVHAHKQSRHQQKATPHPTRPTQHTLGNQAGKTPRHESYEGCKIAPGATATTCFAHDFSRMPVYSRAPANLQAKLTLNAPGDIYEREADRVAEQVMSMPDSQPQRTCACGGGCPGCQHARAHLRTKRVHENVDGEMTAPPIVHEVLRSSGRPLDPSAREFMESRFGHDFSHVRVHTDAQAVESARAVNALAYTAGRDVVFGAGQYTPVTVRGRRLLAHELTHVIQQREGSELKPLKIGASGDWYEREAGAVADGMKRKLSQPQTNVRDDSTAHNVQRQTEAGATPGLSDPLSEGDEKEIGVVLGEPQSSASGLTAKIQIVSGSKPGPGQPDEQKIYGGKMGGHVVINLGAEGVFGFSNDAYGGHFFPRKGDERGSKFEHYTQEEWESKIKGKQVVTFEVDLTLEQAGAIKEAFEGEPDVDYSVLGYRCASYALHALEQAGVIKSSDFKIKYFLAVTPGALVRFLQRQGYSPKVKEGSEKRKWNRRFKSPKSASSTTSSDK